MAYDGCLSVKFCSNFLSGFVLLSFLTFRKSQAFDLCDNNKWCKNGHCCEDGQCCTYYYEMWWFWILWSVVAALLCCCFYQQRKSKRLPWHRLHALPFLHRALVIDTADADDHSVDDVRSDTTAQHHLPPQYCQQSFKPIFDPNKPLVLPAYDELEHVSGNPPAYDVIFHGTNLLGSRQSSCSPGASEAEPVSASCSLMDDSMTATLLDNEEAPDTVDTGRHNLN